jgi:hypothetical protein
LQVDTRRPTTGGDVRLESARELLAIVAHGDAEDDVNVSPITFQLGELDGMRIPQCLAEVRI